MEYIAQNYRDDFAALIRKGRRASQERKALAASLAERGRSVRLVHSDGVRRALAGPDMAGDAPYRWTHFDAAGPCGHYCHNTLQEAIIDALQCGFRPQQMES